MPPEAEGEDIRHCRIVSFVSNYSPAFALHGLGYSCALVTFLPLRVIFGYGVFDE